MVVAIILGVQANLKAGDPCPAPTAPQYADTGAINCSSPILTNKVDSSFIYGAEFVYFGRPTPKLCEADSLGLNYISIGVDNNDPRVSLPTFRDHKLKALFVNGFREKPIKNWAVYYSAGIYNRWEAESSVAVGGVRLDKPSGVGRAVDSGWQADPALGDTAGIFIQNTYGGAYDPLSAHNYTQIKCWGRYRSDTSNVFESQLIDYRVRIWAKVEPYSSTDTTSVLRLSILKGGAVKATRVYRANEFSPPGGKDTLPLFGYNWDALGVAGEKRFPPSPTDTAVAQGIAAAQGCTGRDWVFGAQIRLDWLGGRKVTVDKIEIFDNPIGNDLIARRTLDSTFSFVVDRIKNEQLSVLANDPSSGNPTVTLIKGNDEPSSQDFILCARFIDSLIQYLDPANSNPKQHLIEQVNPVEIDNKKIESYVQRPGGSPPVVLSTPYMLSMTTSSDPDWYDRFPQTCNCSTKVQAAFEFGIRGRAGNILYKYVGHHWADVAKVARDQNPPLPHYTYLQSFYLTINNRDWWREPSGTEMVAMSMLALCYGVKGIIYWSYDGAPGERWGLTNTVNISGTTYPTDKWRAVRDRVTPFLRTLGKTFGNYLTWKTAGHNRMINHKTSSDSLDRTIVIDSMTSSKFWRNDTMTYTAGHPYPATDNLYAEVGSFEDKADTSFFMLVNRRTLANEDQDITVWMNKTGHSYVVDMFSGDTVLTGNVGTGAPFTTHLDPGQGKLFKVVPAPQYIHGTVKHVAWQGKIQADGDVTNPAGWTMKFLPPKMQVVFLANRDTLHTGVNTNKVEFIVKGKVEIRGVPGDTVKFVSSAASPGLEDWYGVRILSAAAGAATDASAKVEYGMFKNAYAALDYANFASDTVKNCLFQNNFMYGIYAKNVNLAILKSSFKDMFAGYGIYLDYANVTVDGNRITNVNFGINAYYSSGAISNDTIITTGSIPMTFGFRAEGATGGQPLLFQSDSVAGRFLQASVVTCGRVNISSSKIYMIGPPEIEYIIDDQFMVAILALGTDSAKVRSSTVRMLGMDNSGIPAILVTGTSPPIDLGVDTTSRNRIFRAAGSYAVKNITASTVSAKGNWWGGTPTSSFFFGPVTYQPYLTSDPPLPKVLIASENSPVRFSLSQNYPNPFNPNTTIRFSLPQAGKVTLAIYNILGERVKTLVDGERAAGVHQIQWDGTDKNGVSVSSGIYLYKIESFEFREVKRMVFLK